MEKLSFTTACLKYFGKKPNQTNTEFMQEMRQLTEEDKAYLTALFPSVGIQIV